MATRHKAPNEVVKVFSIGGHDDMAHAAECRISLAIDRDNLKAE